MWHRRLQDERGMTLVELLVATVLCLIVFSAVVTVVELISRQQPRINEHTQRVEDAQVALERISRAVRQTYSVNSSSSSMVDVLTYQRTGSTAAQRRVVIDCGGGSCTEASGDPNGDLGTSETILTGVTNSDIFTYSPSNVNPQYINIKLRFGVKKDNTDPKSPVTLSDGVKLRNLTTGG